MGHSGDFPSAGNTSSRQEFPTTSVIMFYIPFDIFLKVFNARECTRKAARVHVHNMPPPGKRRRDEEIRSLAQKREKYTAIAWYVQKLHLPP
jgi:hypothetical protein